MRSVNGLLQLASGKHIVADVVLFSAGRIGATDTLHLEAAGLEADARGRLQVAAYNAANKLALLRHATGAAVLEAPRHAPATVLLAPDA